MTKYQFNGGPNQAWTFEFVGGQAQPGYPSVGASTAYPGYPGAQPGYPSQQPYPAYPGAQPGYPAAQPAYPPAQPAYPPAQQQRYTKTCFCSRDIVSFFVPVNLSKCALAKRNSGCVCVYSDCPHICLTAWLPVLRPNRFLFANFTLESVSSDCSHCFHLLRVVLIASSNSHTCSSRYFLLRLLRIVSLSFLFFLFLLLLLVVLLWLLLLFFFFFCTFFSAFFICSFFTLLAFLSPSSHFF